MTTKGRWILGLAAALPALLLGIWLGQADFGGSDGIVAKQDPERAAAPTWAPGKAKIVLAYTGGAADGPGALTLRLFSPSARKNKEPVELSLPKGTWHRVVFDVEDPESHRTELHWQEARPRIFPTAQRIRVGPRTTIEAVYRLAAESVPRAGSKVVARMQVDGREVRSNSITVGERPDNPPDARRAAAQVALRIEDFETLLQTADAMIHASPKAFDGFWFRGLALEGLRQPEAALEAYSRCLELRPRAEKLGSGKELPIALMRRIQALKQRLSKAG